MLLLHNTSLLHFASPSEASLPTSFPSGVPLTSTSGTDPNMAAHFGLERDSSAHPIVRLEGSGDGRQPLAVRASQLEGEEALEPQDPHHKGLSASHSRSNTSLPPTSHEGSSPPSVGHGDTLPVASQVRGSFPREGSVGAGHGYAESSERSSPGQSMSTLTEVSICSQDEPQLPCGDTEHTATPSRPETATDPDGKSDREESSSEGALVPPERTSGLDSDQESSDMSSVRSLSPILPLESPPTSPGREESGEEGSQYSGSPPVPSSDFIARHPSESRTDCSRPSAPLPMPQTTDLSQPLPSLTAPKPQAPTAVPASSQGAPELDGTPTPCLSHPASLHSHPLSTTGPSAATGLRLPNFFMPPHELEQSMRSLRASALSRPPPRLPGLFLTHQSRWRESRGTVGADSSCGQRTFRTVQEINEYLESRRDPEADVAKQLPPQRRPRELTTTEADRIARIFSSKPT